MYIYLTISLLCYLYNSIFFKRSRDYKSIVVLSGDYNWDTLKRLQKGIKLKKDNKKASIIICGKEKSGLIKDELKINGHKDYIVQDKSTNTYEDATYLKVFVSEHNIFPIALVTSQPHMRRSLHTFQRVFPNKKIYPFSTNDLFNLYSPFLPTGWLGAFVNIYKDFKYNGRIF